MTKRITIENASLTMSVAGIAYGFPWVNSITINDQRENMLTGSPQGNGNGIAYRTGTTLPVDSSFVVRDVPEAIFNRMKQAFEDQERVDFLLYDNDGGDQYNMNESVIKTNPSNVDVTEGEETFNVLLNTSCTSNNFRHKVPTDV